MLGQVRAPGNHGNGSSLKVSEETYSDPRVDASVKEEKQRKEDNRTRDNITRTAENEIFLIEQARQQRWKPAKERRTHWHNREQQEKENKATRKANEQGIH